MYKRQVYDGVSIPDERKHLKNNSSEVIKVVVVGSISKQKNQEQIIKAVSKLPNTIVSKLRIDFIGTGNESYVDNIRKLIRNFKMDDFFQFRGFIEDLNGVYENYDVGLITSIGESFGRVTIEYMSNGLLTVVSNSGANPELVEDKISGLVFNSTEELTEILISIVNNYSEMYTIRQNGLNRAYQFVPNIAASKVQKIYNQLVSNHISKN